MTYNVLGNITHKTQTDAVVANTGLTTPQTATSYDVGYAYTSTRPHAATGVGTQSLTYDADGNQLTSSGTFGLTRTMTWSEEDRLRTEADRSFTTSFLYDAEGNRSHKRRTTLETVYVVVLHLTEHELIILANAIHETLEPVDASEFDTRVGATPEEVNVLRRKLGTILEALQGR
jgi:hypothetical protein